MVHQVRLPRVAARTVGTRERPLVCVPPEVSDKRRLNERLGTQGTRHFRLRIVGQLWMVMQQGLVQQHLRLGVGLVATHWTGIGYQLFADPYIDFLFLFLILFRIGSPTELLLYMMAKGLGHLELRPTKQTAEEEMYQLVSL